MNRVIGVILFLICGTARAGNFEFHRWAEYALKTRFTGTTFLSPGGRGKVEECKVKYRPKARKVMVRCDVKVSDEPEDTAQLVRSFNVGLMFRHGNDDRHELRSEWVSKELPEKVQFMRENIVNAVKEVMGEFQFPYQKKSRRTALYRKNPLQAYMQISASMMNCDKEATVSLKTRVGVYSKLTTRGKADFRFRCIYGEKVTAKAVISGHNTATKKFICFAQKSEFAVACQ